MLCIVAMFQTLYLVTDYLFSQSVFTSYLSLDKSIKAGPLQGYQLGVCPLFEFGYVQNIEI